MCLIRKYIRCTCSGNNFQTYTQIPRLFWIFGFLHLCSLSKPTWFLNYIMATKGKRVRASMKKRQEEVEKMKALMCSQFLKEKWKLRKFPGAKAVHCDCCMSLMNHLQSWHWRGLLSFECPFLPFDEDTFPLKNPPDLYSLWEFDTKYPHFLHLAPPRDR